MVNVSSVRGNLKRNGYYRGGTADIKRELQPDKTYVVIDVGNMPVEKQILLSLTCFGIEQQGLAKELGVSPSLVSKWLKGLPITDKHKFKIMNFVAGNYNN